MHIKDSANNNVIGAIFIFTIAIPTTAKAEINL